MKSSASRTMWVVMFGTVLLWSGCNPHDRFTWVLEVLPAVMAALVLAATRNRFPLTPLAYQLILIHCVVLMVGGHYTYARVPVGDWLMGLLDLQRNHYDKLGHLFQGLVPTLVARELLLRLRVLARAGWLNFVLLSFALAVSAFYELIEWWVAVLSETAADAFLGTQGYVWDTQSDMAMALLGSLGCIVLLRQRHDHQLRQISSG